MTRPDWEMLDPVIDKPPQGVDLLVISKGGVLAIGPWREDHIAWSPKPKIPKSVKEREAAKFEMIRHRGV